MTTSYSLRTLTISLLMVLAGITVLALQYAFTFLTQGLDDSAGIRVSSNTAPACSTTGAHFTGCSSIL